MNFAVYVKPHTASWPEGLIL